MEISRSKDVFFDECKKRQLRNEYYMTSLEENIASDDIVRVIDEIVEQLDLKKLGFVMRSWGRGW